MIGDGENQRQLKMVAVSRRSPVKYTNIIYFTSAAEVAWFYSIWQRNVLAIMRSELLGRSIGHFGNYPRASIPGSKLCVMVIAVPSVKIAATVTVMNVNMSMGMGVDLGIGIGVGMDIGMGTGMGMGTGTVTYTSLIRFDDPSGLLTFAGISNDRRTLFAQS